jgi:hypothetical protein
MVDGHAQGSSNSCLGTAADRSLQADLVAAWQRQCSFATALGKAAAAGLLRVCVTLQQPISAGRVCSSQKQQQQQLGATQAGAQHNSFLGMLPVCVLLAAELLMLLLPCSGGGFAVYLHGPGHLQPAGQPAHRQLTGLCVPVILPHM